MPDEPARPVPIDPEAGAAARIPALLKEWRRLESLDLAQAAARLGTNSEQLKKIEQGAALPGNAGDLAILLTAFVDYALAFEASEIAAAH